MLLSSYYYFKACTSHGYAEITADELAFYDALTELQAIKVFYENEELIAIIKGTDVCSSKQSDNRLAEARFARAKMRMMIKMLLKKHKYSPEGTDDAVQTVLLHCELGTNYTDMDDRVVLYANWLGQYVSATHV